MNIKKVARVVTMVESSQLHSVSIEKNGQTITVINSQPLSSQSSLPDQHQPSDTSNDKRSNRQNVRQNSKQNDNKKCSQIHAPYIGTVRLSPDLVTAPLVCQNDGVSEGQTLGYIEQCARLLPIISDSAGIITDIFIKEGQDVEYGQALFGLSGC